MSHDILLCKVFLHPYLLGYGICHTTHSHADIPMRSTHIPCALLL